MLKLQDFKDYCLLTNDSLSYDNSGVSAAIEYAQKYDLDVFSVGCKVGNIVVKPDVPQKAFSFPVFVRKSFFDIYCKTYEGVNARIHWSLFRELGYKYGRFGAFLDPISNLDVNFDQEYDILATCWVWQCIVRNTLDDIHFLNLREYRVLANLINCHPFFIKSLNSLGIYHSDEADTEIDGNNEIYWVKDPRFKLDFDPKYIVEFSDNVLKIQKDQFVQKILEVI